MSVLLRKDMTVLFAGLFLLGAIAFVGLKSADRLPFLHDNQASAAAMVLPENLNDVGVSAKPSIRKLRQNIALDLRAIKEAHGQDIRRLFGQPDLVLSELPTTIWQFQNEDCALNIYFVHKSHNVLNAPASHYDVRARNDAASVDRCAVDLMKTKSGTGFMSLGAL